MRVDLFDFELPPERIALRPAEPRDSARLLCVDPQARQMLRDNFVRDLPQFLRPGDVLVVNDTRVIPARLSGVRARGENVARIEATLHKRESAERWRAFLKPAKRVNAGERIRFGSAPENMACMLAHLDALVVEKGEDGEALLEFELSGAALDEAIMAIGHMPLPPYIASKRGEDVRDTNDYQTLFAREPGAVAAPTAGLHYTPELVAAIEARGVQIAKVTLHVGAGTFLPVKAQDTSDHRMHAEFGILSEQVARLINDAREAGGRVIATGTTCMRILESAADDGGLMHPFAGDTSIFITPGYRFKCVDLLLTNFHLPRSTLFMLVSAFCGLDVMKKAYAHAIAQSYRFYSYGDACLLARAGGSGFDLQARGDTA